MSMLSTSLSRLSTAELTKTFFSAFSAHHDGVCDYIWGLLNRRGAGFDVHFARLTCLLRSEHIEAARDFGRELAAGGGSAWYRALVDVLFGHDLPDAVVNDAKRKTEYWYVRGQALARMKAWGLALQAFGRSVEAGHHCIERILAQHEIDYIATYKPLPAAITGADPYSLLRLASEYGPRGQVVEAYQAASLAYEQFTTYGELESIEVVSALAMMAENANAQGDTRHAIACIHEAKRIWEILPGAPARTCALIDTIHSTIELKLGRHPSAFSYAENAVKLLRECADREADDLGGALNQAAKAAHAGKRNREALELARESLSERERAFGPSTMPVSKALATIAGIQAAEQKWGECLVTVRRAIEIRHASKVEVSLALRILLADALRGTGNLVEAKGLIDQILREIQETDEAHEAREAAALLASRIAMDSEDSILALDMAFRADESELHVLAELLPVTDRASRPILLVEHRHSFDVMNEAWMKAGRPSAYVPRMWSSVSRRKLLPMLITQKNRGHQDESWFAAFQEYAAHSLTYWRSMCVTRLLSDGEKPAADPQKLLEMMKGTHQSVGSAAEMDSAGAKFEIAERINTVDPTRQIVARLAKIDASALEDAVPADAVVLDYVAVCTEAGWLYRCIVFSKAHGTRIIDTAGCGFVTDTLREIRSQAASRRIQRSGGDPAQELLQSLARELLWPIERELGALPKQLIIVPDADVHSVPWDALPLLDGSPLYKACAVRWLQSSAELLERRAPIQAGSPVIFGGPDYSAPLANTASDAQDVFGSGTSNLKPLFSPLPASADEALAVHQFVGGELRRGADATKTRLAAIERPSILHLATHAFACKFEPDKRYAAPEVAFHAQRFRTVEPTHALDLLSELYDPGLRVGLALAGANTWFRSGIYKNFDDTGLMLGHEILSLNLSGTEMVVLSACESALGDCPPLGAEIGLRGFFSIAGARTVIATLWRVADRGALCLMNHFYTNLSDGLPRLEALRLAKESTAKAGFGWRIYAAFVLYGDDGPLQCAT